ncbi:MAG: 1-deoxy-D-xylulose-5-phosphate synthase [Dehalococcoidia bacterium]|nr:1-deoxy-D-xylulose-5-phosphate synthase [Dehalococcoidia bacterium]
MPRLLGSIDSPADLKKIPVAELSELAEEIRQEIIDTTQLTGGHLASSLGAVELSIALHRVFDSPRDKIIWDVGHQSYAHKLLTGRRELFRTLRQMGGISGFPVRDESPHDAFGAGHASTSVSAALGMAAARDLKNENYHVIAVIGDGSITGGMAFEGLNNSAHLGARLIVILNDNGMSISPTVGGLSKLLSQARFDHRLHHAAERGKRIVTSLPGGKTLWDFARRLKSGVRGLVLPTVLWEELGFAYMGPVDGHDTAELEAALTRARMYTRRPVLLHAVTTKGKGYKPAEDDAICFHGISPKQSAVKVSPSYSQVFAETMLKIMRDDPDVAVITAAMPEGNCLGEVQQAFASRVFDVGICEQHAVTFAAGLAAQGIRPVVAIYSTFLQRSLDQILHDVALQKLPVVFALDRGGIVGDDGKTHQGIFDLSYLSLIPNLIVSAPKDENDLQHLLYTAVYGGSPMAVRYPRGPGLGVRLDGELRRLPIGQGEMLRLGCDLAILAVGSAVETALEAAGEMAAMGVKAAVVNMRFIKPIDGELIAQLSRNTARFLTVEENVLCGGFGSAVTAHMRQKGIEAKIHTIGIPDEFVPHGTQRELRARYGLDSLGIVRAALVAYPELALTRDDLVKT